jgi:hypothetical protein
MVFKCKICGGDIQAEAGVGFGTCDSCGTTSTLPKANDERIINLFNRANHLRRHHEFDKALATYESLLTEDPTNAEAHWCLVLCRYGIEYVEDPKTHERIPTCHRTQMVSILTDADYLSALDNTPDTYTRNLYEDSAKRIHEIQRDILSISNQEDPYDVFICYKESTDGGSRTKDSTLAQDIYYQLTKENMRVFFARITLEEKIGRQYEPFIFNALHTAKVMLVIGTRKEYFEAVWVKNEWSRFLTMMKNDRSRLLIPCYRDMDAYDLPEELSAFQAQDMGKIGFLQDLIRGVKKVIDAEKVTTTPQPIVTQATTSVGGVDPLVRRAFLLIEESDFDKAGELLDQALNLDPENAKAYVGQLLVTLKITTEAQLGDNLSNWQTSAAMHRALRFANVEYKATLESYAETASKNNLLMEASQYVKYDESLLKAIMILENIKGFKNADEIFAYCHKRQQEIYDYAVRQMTDAYYQQAYDIFIMLQGQDYKDASEQAQIAAIMIEEQKAAQKERERKDAARKRKTIFAIGAFVATIIIGIFVYSSVINPYLVNNRRYNQAIRLTSQGHYDEAARIFWQLGNFRNSWTLAWQAKEAEEEAGIESFRQLQLRMELQREQAELQRENERNERLAAEYNKNVNTYRSAMDAFNRSDYETAYLYFHSLGDFRDSRDMAMQSQNRLSETHPETIKKYQLYANLITTFESNFIGLRTDGTIGVTMNVSDSTLRGLTEWKDIVAVSGLVGLKSDGTVVNVNNEIISGFDNIVAVSFSALGDIVGVRANGTVVVSGNNLNNIDVSDWRDIVYALPVVGGRTSTREHWIVGLKNDGTVISSNSFIQGWTDIVTIAAGGNGSVIGLKTDGTVVVVATNFGETLNLDWRNIVAVVAGNGWFAGLTANGTVVSTSPVFQNVGWGNIVALSAGWNISNGTIHYLMGLTTDGHIIGIGTDISTVGRAFNLDLNNLRATDSGSLRLFE